MKKLISLSMLIIFITLSASAQIRERARHHSHRHEFRTGNLTRPELRELKRDHARYKVIQHRARRDGVVTPFERKRLQKVKMQNRREAFRFKHNRQRRLI